MRFFVPGHKRVIDAIPGHWRTLQQAPLLLQACYVSIGDTLGQEFSGIVSPVGVIWPVARVVVQQEVPAHRICRRKSLEMYGRTCIRWITRRTVRVTAVSKGLLSHRRRRSWTRKGPAVVLVFRTRYFQSYVKGQRSNKKEFDRSATRYLKDLASLLQRTSPTGRGYVSRYTFGYPCVCRSSGVAMLG